MSLKVNIDIVCAFEALRIRSFRKQGLLRFRTTLFQTTKKPSTAKNIKNVTVSACRIPH